MTIAEMTALASPPCHECGEPVQRVEMPWRLTSGGEWLLSDPAMVCRGGHRVTVEPLPLAGPWECR